MGEMSGYIDARCMRCKRPLSNGKALCSRCVVLVKIENSEVLEAKKNEYLRSKANSNNANQTK